MSDERVVEALEALADGRIVVLAGDGFRGGDIDFCLAARHASAEAIGFVAEHGRGLVCLALTPTHAARLGIALIDPERAQQAGRTHGRSIAAAGGDPGDTAPNALARTVAMAVSAEANAADLQSPGHVFPLIAAERGLRERAAAAEAGIELCRRAGAGDAAVICSILRDDGEMARPDDIASLMAQHGIVTVDIALLLAG